MTRTITVHGTGNASAVPDLLSLTVGIETRRQGAAEAFSEAGRASRAVIAELRKHGVADADVRTGTLALRGEIAWQEGSPRVSGYVAVTQLLITLREMDRAADIISATVGAGGDDVRINGLEAGFADSAAVTALARESAWQEAKTKAEHLASLAGAVLGKVVSIEENPPASGPVPVTMARAAAVEPVEIAPGESSVTAAVTVRWELRSGR